MLQGNNMRDYLVFFPHWPFGSYQRNFEKLLISCFAFESVSLFWVVFHPPTPPPNKTQLLTKR